MKPPLKLGLYGAGLALIFGASFLVASAVVPPEWTDAWQPAPTESHEPGHPADSEHRQIRNTP